MDVGFGVAYFLNLKVLFCCLLACMLFEGKYALILIFVPLYLKCLFFPGCQQDFLLIFGFQKFVMCLVYYFGIYHV